MVRGGFRDREVNLYGEQACRGFFAGIHMGRCGMWNTPRMEGSVLILDNSYEYYKQSIAQLTRIWYLFPWFFAGQPQEKTGARISVWEKTI